MFTSQCRCLYSSQTNYYSVEMYFIQRNIWNSQLFLCYLMCCQCYTSVFYVYRGRVGCCPKFLLTYINVYVVAYNLPSSEICHYWLYKSKTATMTWTLTMAHALSIFIKLYIRNTFDAMKWLLWSCWCWTITEKKLSISNVHFNVRFSALALVRRLPRTPILQTVRSCASHLLSPTCFMSSFIHSCHVFFPLPILRL